LSTCADAAEKSTVTGFKAPRLLRNMAAEGRDFYGRFAPDKHKAGVVQLL